MWTEKWTKTRWIKTRHPDETWAFAWDCRWKYSTVFHPHEARQQLGCPLFLLDEWAPPYKATPKMGCWNQIHKMSRVTFCLTIFSSPDKKHNIALSSNYDLRMLHNTKHMIFFFSYVLIALIILQMMGHERKEPEFQNLLRIFFFLFFLQFQFFPVKNIYWCRFKCPFETKPPPVFSF